MENRKKIKSDLDAVRGKTPLDRHQAALSDPDAQPVTREMFLKAVPWESFKSRIIKKKDVHMFLDEDIIEFFKKAAEGKRGYQTLINGVLREYMQHHKQI
jgi:uncharacterized protein (DUF4415 family)